MFLQVTCTKLAHMDMIMHSSIGGTYLGTMLVEKLKLGMYEYIRYLYVFDSYNKFSMLTVRKLVGGPRGVIKPFRGC